MRIVSLLIAMAVAVGMSGEVPARWLKAKTQNFIIYSGGSEKSLRSFAENLQRFDATLRFRFKLDGAPDPNRLPIYLVERAADAGRLSSGKANSSMIAGFIRRGGEDARLIKVRDALIKLSATYGGDAGLV